MADRYINIKTGKVISLNADYLPLSFMNDLKPVESFKNENIPDVLKNTDEPVKRRRNGKKE